MCVGVYVLGEEGKRGKEGTKQSRRGRVEGKVAVYSHRAILIE